MVGPLLKRREVTAIANRRRSGQAGSRPRPVRVSERTPHASPAYSNQQQQ
jgi:hypothetical protein